MSGYFLKNYTLHWQYVGCFFKFHLVVGVEESIVNAPLV
jgi:hypothetical protein